MKKKTLVIGNWKQNPPTLDKAKKLFIDIRNAVKTKYQDVVVVVAAPTPFSSELSRLSPSGRVMLAAQDVSLYDLGAHTGEVALSMVTSVGVEYVIVGHSERRAMGETDEIIKQKLNQITSRGRGVLCIGESTRDGQADYFSVIEKQLYSAFAGLTSAQVKRVVIAYEPIWAIGTGKNASVEMIEEMRLFIQKVLTDLYDRAIGAAVPILYGGSVRANNAEDILRFSAVDGFLVGGASLKAAEFINIIATAHVVRKETT